ncbi:MAG: threonylcarbamoyl-AMP synthase [Candidatus Obscuribacterales bacterium]|nr:threonylcarbamoyl-AMP synthase [Candidatus Obscuribacterales bacterium]
MIEESKIKAAAMALTRGQLVAFPTETVYGLGADASNQEALEKLFRAKGRPTHHPLIVHIGKEEELDKWCAEVPDAARLLAKLFWPGALTLVLKKAKSVSPLLTGGQDTIAIRMPSHPVALKLLHEFGSGVAAPSANKFGRLSPTTADDVKAEFGDEIEIVLDGGQCEVGIESTILDLTVAEPRILRPGMIQAETLFLALAEIGLSGNRPQADSEVPRVPGALKSHYAPKTPMMLVSSSDLDQVLENFEREGKDAAVLSFKAAPMFHRNWITVSKFAPHYAHMLYKHLHKLDSLGADLIVVEEPPAEPDWEGIADRLSRAAYLDAGEEKIDGA